MDELEERIRPGRIRYGERRPAHGEAGMHWEKARILVAIEDDRTGLKPVEESKAEDAWLIENLGEFPGAMTDRGHEQQFPRAARPESRAARR